MTRIMKNHIVRRTTLYIVLLFGALMAMFPFYWMVSSALKPSYYILAFPPVIIPPRLSLEHFEFVFETMNVYRALLNSLVVAVSQVSLNLFFSSLMAYALAKLKFPGRNALFVIVLAFMMIPFQLMIVPLFLTVNSMGLIGTFPAIILPGTVSSFSIFLLRQAMLSVPNDYVEAALIDGGNHFYICFRIVMPMIVPLMMTVIITNFMWTWNDFLWPMMVTVGNDDMSTIQVALNRYRSLNEVRWGPIMAACTIAALPIATVYMILQKQFIESVATSGIKG